ncbi:wD repeat domain [Nowakowskiella sp. JEL0078]|nr:wD repeat domain [Nowakowskiella sp. JEL0078]
MVSRKKIKNSWMDMDCRMITLRGSEKSANIPDDIKWIVSAGDSGSEFVVWSGGCVERKGKVTVVAWDCCKKKLATILVKDRVTDMKVFRDYVIVACKSVIWIVWNSSDGLQWRKSGNERILRESRILCVDAKNDKIVVGFASPNPIGCLALFDLNPNKMLTLKSVIEIQKTNISVSCVSLSQCGLIMVAGTNNGSILIWKLENDTPIAFVGHKGSISNISIVSVSLERFLIISADAHGSFLIWCHNTTTQTPPELLLCALSLSKFAEATSTKEYFMSLIEKTTDSSKSEYKLDSVIISEEVSKPDGSYQNTSSSQVASSSSLLCSKVILTEGHAVSVSSIHSSTHIIERGQQNEQHWIITTTSTDGNLCVWNFFQDVNMNPIFRRLGRIIQHGCCDVGLKGSLICGVRRRRVLEEKIPCYSNSKNNPMVGLRYRENFRTHKGKNSSNYSENVSGTKRKTNPVRDNPDAWIWEMWLCDLDSLLKFPGEIIEDEFIEILMDARTIRLGEDTMRGYGTVVDKRRIDSVLDDTSLCEKDICVKKISSDIIMPYSEEMMEDLCGHDFEPITDEGYGNLPVLVVKSISMCDWGAVCDFGNVIKIAWWRSE